MANWLKRGGRGTARKGFKNTTYKAAQKRIHEAVDPMHRKNENALKVEGLKVIIFKQTSTFHGRPCTCSSFAHEGNEHSPLLDAMDIDHEPQEVLENVNGPMPGIQFENRGSDFLGDTSVAHKGVHHGDSPNKITELGNIQFKAEDDGELEDAIEGLDPELQAYYKEGLFSGSSVNCGICYRKGNDPAYICYDHMFETLTPYKAKELIGYAVEEDEKPNKLMKVADQGKVIFEVDIPKYFKSLRYSVRNNEDVLTFTHIYDLKTNGLISLKSLDQYRGKKFQFYVNADVFTHVNLVFDLGMEPVYSNVSEMGSRWEAETEDTSGGLTFALPARVGSIKAGDVIYIPERRRSYIVTDAPRKELVNRTVIEWVATTRVLQNHEPLRYIARGYSVE